MKKIITKEHELDEMLIGTVLFLIAFIVVVLSLIVLWLLCQI